MMHYIISFFDIAMGVFSYIILIPYLEIYSTLSTALI